MSGISKKVENLVSEKPNTRGILAAALAACGFSMSLISAGFALRSGADPATLVVVRGTVGVLIGLVMVRFMVKSLKFDPKAALPLALMTVGMTAINYGYMGAIQYIPISLATLVFYMFPMAVLFVTSVASRRMPSLVAGLAFLLSFAGLASAIGPSLSDLDGRGLAWALSATAGATLMFFYGAIAAQRTGVALFTLYSQAAIAGFGIFVMLALGGPHLPTGETGSVALICICIGYSIGILMQFFAVRLIKPALAAMIFNIEPVATISLSAVLLGDLLSVGQYLGGAFVIAGVLLATRVANRI